MSRLWGNTPSLPHHNAYSKVTTPTPLVFHMLSALQVIQSAHTSTEIGPKDVVSLSYQTREVLTMKRNGCVCSFCLFCLFQVQQGRCKQRVIDEMLHIVLLTLFLGLGAHLIGNILPRVGRKRQKEVTLSFFCSGQAWLLLILTCRHTPAAI